MIVHSDPNLVQIEFTDRINLVQPRLGGPIWGRDRLGVRKEPDPQDTHAADDPSCVVLLLHLDFKLLAEHIRLHREHAVAYATVEDRHRA